MMQEYKSHKIVQAGRIQRIHTVGDVIDFVEAGGKQYQVPPGFAAREKQPEIGDYLVRYEDGYLSWSPAAAFEGGYRLVEDDDVQTDGSADKDGNQA
jgi:hypothetical protein